MLKRQFIYTTYIRATPECVWHALTDPALVKQWWGISLETDWKAGSTITYKVGPPRDVIISDADQVVLEADRPRRLSYTWHTFTREWAAAYGIDEGIRSQLSSEPRSTVLVEIEPFEHQVKLIVTHDNFGDGTAVLEGVSEEWPLILSNLKSLLEAAEAWTTVDPAGG